MRTTTFLPSQRTQWLTVALLFGLSFASYVERVNISVADTVNALDDVGSKVLGRPPSKTVRRLYVATYFVAAFIPSAIGLLGAFGQKPLQIS